MLYVLFTKFVTSKRLFGVSCDRAFSVVICYLNLDNSNHVDNEQERPRHWYITPQVGILYPLAWALLITHGRLSRAKVA